MNLLHSIASLICTRSVIGHTPTKIFPVRPALTPEFFPPNDSCLKKIQGRIQEVFKGVHSGLLAAPKARKKALCAVGAKSAGVRGRSPRKILWDHAHFSVRERPFLIGLDNAHFRGDTKSLVHGRKILIQQAFVGVSGLTQSFLLKNCKDYLVTQ